MNEMEGPEHGLPAALIDEWSKKDPVKRMKEHLVQTGVMSEAAFTTLKQGYQKHLDEAFDRARNSDYASFEEVFTDVYAEGGMIE